MWTTAQLFDLVSQACKTTSVSAAKQAIGNALYRDPCNSYAGTMAAVLGALPPGDIRSVVSPVYSVEGPKGQATTDVHTTKVWALAKAYADSLAPVLVNGESGTGKEVLARILHEESARKEKPFIAINCGGFTETLVESELFGYEKGAFTGATSTKRGSLEAAGEGTVFLDEIGELPLTVQVRLLRVLEDRSFRRVGGDGSNPLSFRGRIVAATHRNLVEQVRLGHFREDLYYRIAVLLLQTNALRNRVEDAVMLAERWLKAEMLLLSDAAANALRAYHFPGNIRELSNLVKRAAIHARIENRTTVVVDDLGLLN